MIMPRGLLSLLVGGCTCLAAVSPVGAVVSYVNINAQPGGDGLSWPTAYGSLSTAIAAAEPGDQIWVATGNYVGNFTLAIDVELYGGFAGMETELNQRDWKANPTILDGNESGSVVTSPPGATKTTRIDGFTITGGEGQTCPAPSGFHTCGGGMYNIGSSPTVSNCTFNENAADYGGGMYNRDISNPTVSNCTFLGNTARDYYGGGMHNVIYSSPTVTDCTFSSNWARSGGGMYNEYHSNPAVTNCTFTGNTALGEGGGICNENVCSPAVTKCTFSRNTAHYGGGMNNRDSSNPTVSNCTFSGNFAGYAGGGICNQYYSDPVVTNCTFSGNTTYTSGSGMANKTGSSPTVTNCTFSGNTSIDFHGVLYNKGGSPAFTNCIIWGNTSNEIYKSSSTCTVTHSCIQDDDPSDGLAFPGTGNIDTNPVFVRNPNDGGDGWGDDPDTAEIDEGANDDFGDLRLQSVSPSNNTGDPQFIPTPGETDLDGHARVLCGRVDMGAYEFGIGDYDCNDAVDLDDFSMWAACMTGPDSGSYDPGCVPFDFEYDGDVDIADVAGYQRIFTGEP